MAAVLARPSTARTLRQVGAASVLVNGAIHLWLYLGEYHHIHIIGPLFVVNAVAAVVIAIGVVATTRDVFAFAALAFSLLTLGAFVLSRTSGLFGFQESDIDLKAIVAIASELIVVAVLGLWFANTRPRPHQPAVLGDRMVVGSSTSRTAMTRSEPARSQHSRS